MAGDVAARIEAANAEAVDRMIRGEPVLTDVAVAGEVIDGLAENKILHAGPPIDGMAVGVPGVQEVVEDLHARGFVVLKEALGELVGLFADEALLGAGVEGRCGEHVGQQGGDQRQVFGEDLDAPGHQLLAHDHREVGSESKEESVDRFRGAVARAPLVRTKTSHPLA